MRLVTQERVSFSEALVWRGIPAVEHAQEFALSGEQPFEDAVEGGVAGSSLEDAVEAGVGSSARCGLGAN